MPAGKDEDKEEEMYDKIEELIEEEKGSSNLVVMGDWNAVVGEGKEGKVIGKFGLGVRNEKGQRLLEFCEKHKLVVTNTWFQTHKRKIYTWKSPGDLERYQLDYILVRQRYRNGVKSSFSYPGADCDSDHNMVMLKMKIRLKKIRQQKREARYDLSDQQALYQFKEKTDMRMKERKKEERLKDVDEGWKEFKNIIMEEMERNIPKQKTPCRKPWITTEILEMMDERRKWKCSQTERGKQKYRQLNNKIRKTCNKTKTAYWREQCSEIERLAKANRVDKVYEKVKALTGGMKNKVPTTIKDENGRVLSNENDVLNRWKLYVETLYNKDEKPNNIMVEGEEEVSDENKGPSILKSEVVWALKHLKNKKATGIDKVPAEVLKLLGEEGIEELWNLCNEMYNSGNWPEDFVTSILIPIPKKVNANDCKLFRTISLISHASKIMLKILHSRLTGKAENFLSPSQFGFRKYCGTRDATGVMRQIIERRLEIGEDTYICFVDFEKAFDRVNWDLLLKALKQRGVDWKDRRMIANLYMKQSTVVRVNNKHSERCDIGQGVRQGCLISPTLFSIYAEEIMLEAFYGADFGIKVGGKKVVDVRFADDQAMIANNEKELQTVMDLLDRSAKKFNMKINVEKTKVMCVSKESKEIKVKLDGKWVQQVKRFTYLGTIITSNGYTIEDIKTRIALAKKKFAERREILSGDVSIELRKRLVKCLVWSVATFGAETWILSKEAVRRIEGFEMWCWRRLLKVRWTDRKTNEWVLAQIGAERTMLKMIEGRKKRWLGHVARHEGMLKQVIEGKMEGRRGRGRRRMGMISDMGKYEEWKRLAEDRSSWRLTMKDLLT